MRTSIRIERAANGLALCGIVPGDRIALLVPNIPEFVVAYYAVPALWWNRCAINVLYNAEEIAYRPGDIATICYTSGTNGTRQRRDADAPELRLQLRTAWTGQTVAALSAPMSCCSYCLFSTFMR